MVMSGMDLHDSIIYKFFLIFYFYLDPHNLELRRILMKSKVVLTTLAALVVGMGSAYAADNPSMDAKAAGDAFLATNKTKQGVITTTSGLEYKVIRQGTGTDKPSSNDVVQINYTGKLLDGKEFDSSKGTPVSFPVNGVIPGFSEALKLMKKGDVFEVYIPSNLAYGENGVPNTPIGPNQTLIFTIELLDIKKS